MPDFQITLTFRNINRHKPPREKTLLFYNDQCHGLAKGWLQPEGLVLVGAQWRPTHFAEFTDPLQSTRQHLLHHDEKP